MSSPSSHLSITTDLDQLAASSLSPSSSPDIDQHYELIDEQSIQEEGPVTIHEETHSNNEIPVEGGTEEEEEENLQEVIERLKSLYEEESQAEIPQRDVMFHCGVGLEEAEEFEAAEHAFRDLISVGYRVVDSYFHLSVCLFHQGYIVDAKEALRTCLTLDPNHVDALQFKEYFKEKVDKDGKIAIYGLLSFTAIVALFFAWRRTRNSA